jgi:hypothetical protein
MALHVIFAAGLALAQDNHHESRLGLSTKRILAMKPEAWAEYYNQKNPGGEAGYDEAYRTYAECLKERSEPRLARLYRTVQARVRKYRTLCGKFRVDNLYLQQAYAGGGTLYSHAAERGAVEDEQLVEKLIKRYSDLVGPDRTPNWRTTIRGLRNRIRKQNPAKSQNRKKLAEFNMVEQGETSYKDLLRDLDAIEALLATERPDVRAPVVSFLVEEGAQDG